MITRRRLLVLCGLSAVAVTTRSAGPAAEPSTSECSSCDAAAARVRALIREAPPSAPCAEATSAAATPERCAGSSTAAADAGLAGPGRGRRAARWAMVVDVARCRRDAGCTDCIAACHAAHNVPDVPEPRHRVRWLAKEPFGRVFPEQVEWSGDGVRAPGVPVMCNHCDNPPCVRVCPTKATFKRADGIVAMDWHRCIGCKYCVVACPYGARAFNFLDPRPHVRRIDPDFPTRVHGVVEKCTFCADRLDAGRSPACVEACRDKALVCGDLHDPASPVRALLGGRVALRRKPELGTGPAVFYLV